MAGHIGGGKFVQLQLARGEQVVLQSGYDVEEISGYGDSLNPLNLFVRGSTFQLGYLFLTSHRLMLLPYSQDEVDRAQLFGKVAYKVLDKVGFGIPQPKIGFAAEPLQIALEAIYSVNPYRKQFGIHPTLELETSAGRYRFKFVPRESPAEWATAIQQLSGCDVQAA